MTNRIKTKKNQKKRILLYLFVSLTGITTCFYITKNVVNSLLFSQNVSQKQSLSCPSASSQHYDSLTTYRPRPHPETNPELNITMRGYREVNQAPTLINYGGDTDPVMPPNFGTLFQNRLPSIVKTYSVFKWDYTNNRRSTEIETNWPVNLVGLSTSNGEPVVAPKAGRDIGGGHVLMVLYATENTIVFTHSYSDLYTDSNGNFNSDGYLIYIDDICVDPNLLSSYRSADTAGRGSLPVLTTGQIFGYGKGIDIKVGIRDSMDWMDPRSRKDWWQGIGDLPPVAPPSPPATNPLLPTAIPLTQPIYPTTPPYYPSPTSSNPQPTTVYPTYPVWPTEPFSTSIPTYYPQPTQPPWIRPTISQYLPPQASNPPQLTINPYITYPPYPTSAQTNPTVYLPPTIINGVITYPSVANQISPQPTEVFVLITTSPGQGIWVRPTGAPAMKLPAIKTIFTGLGDFLQKTRDSIWQFLNVVLP